MIESTKIKGCVVVAFTMFCGLFVFFFFNIIIIIKKHISKDFLKEKVIKPAAQQYH